MKNPCTTVCIICGVQATSILNIILMVGNNSIYVHCSYSQHEMAIFSLSERETKFLFRNVFARFDSMTIVFALGKYPLLIFFSRF